MKRQQQVSEETMAAIIGETPARLAELAAQGHFPKAKNGRYPLGVTLQGFFRRLLQDCLAAAAEDTRRRQLIPAEIAHEVQELIVRKFCEEIESIPRLAEEIARTSSPMAVGDLLFQESKRIRKRVVAAVVARAHEIANRKS